MIKRRTATFVATFGFAVVASAWCVLWFAACDPVAQPTSRTNVDGGVGPITDASSSATSSSITDADAVAVATSYPDAFAAPGEIFTAINGIADDDIWAVGDGGLARHWDGTSWTRILTGGFYLFSSVWGGADDAWAVAQDGIVVHWDGHTWQRTDTTDFYDPMTTGFFGVWSAGPNDTWMVGYSVSTTPGVGPGLIAHFDGAAWKRIPIAVPDALMSVSGVAPNDVWAVGSSGLNYHWNGTTWTRVDGPTTQYQFGVWGSATNDFFAVGRGGSVTRFDGKAWSLLASDGNIEFDAVSGANARDVWAVGVFNRLSTVDGSAPMSGRLAGHWDGNMWWQCEIQAVPLVPQGIWASKTGKVWVAGDSIMEVSMSPEWNCKP